jgi:hypothetical protein
MKHRAVKGPCICGCGARGVKHHVVAVQKLRELAGRDPDRELLLGLDARNLVRVAPSCHGNHHNASRRLQLRWLPDSVFEFAAEVMGSGPAYEYLRRYYDGTDPRLTNLLADYARMA